jgi:acyl-coenzyme A thioesterase PaaI-like protein
MSQPSDVGWEPTPERRELGEALRRLLDVVVRTGAPREDMRAATAAIDEMTAKLATSTVRAGRSVAAGSYRAHMSLVGGLSHPVAPQLLMEVNGDAGRGEVALGPVFQGGPGLAHGGVLALLIDHAMGCVAAGPERPAMTAGLTLRYRKPTPLGVPLTVSVRLDRVEGRKLHLTAEIIADGEITVDADAVFLTLTQENLETVFRDPA